MITKEEIQSVKNRFGIIGNSPVLNYALSVAVQVAPTDLTVLITGESGSGKESFSKIIHGLSPRKHGNFIAINCGAIPEGTIDSELFGHVKGSFTGALDDRKGYFETTDNGTIFLDEIGEMPLGTQARLLRVLENGEFIPVGSSKIKKTNVRVVAATNVNLLSALEKGTFREDLYYRLNTVPITVPPLRDRGFDIELLFLKFTTDFAEKNRIEPIELTDEARKMLQEFRFPGNIRQLKNIAEQITLLSPSREVSAEELSNYLPKTQFSNLPMVVPQAAESFSEREILYKILFELREDVNELKKLVINMLTSGVNPEFVQNNAELIQNLSPEAYTILNGNGYESEKLTLLPERTPYYHAAQEESYVEDIPVEMHMEESLSLEKKEKEMIIKALRKNNFKRRYAAEDLGISERTLYRKIKQYDIEDEK